MMTDRQDNRPDPAAVGDTQDRLDHTGGGEALAAGVTAADEDYVRRHAQLPEADHTEEPADPSPEQAMREDPGGSPVPGGTGAAASTGPSRGAPTPSR